MLNHITVMGRLTKDPDIRHTQAGDSVLDITIASDRDMKNKTTGVRATDFIDIVAWGGTAEFIANHFGKGQMIIVDGRLGVNDWEDRDGKKRRSAAVVAKTVYFGDSKRPAAPEPQEDMAEPEMAEMEETDPAEGELPF